MSITTNITEVKALLPDTVTLVAVSKTKPIEMLQEAYNAGVRIFGENKVQEMCQKQEILPKDIEWHMIGHLQSNKVKYIAPFVSLIHSVDSLKLLNTINKESIKNNRQIDVLLQIHIAEEESKFGLTPSELTTLLQSEQFHTMENIRIVGLMGMATNTADTSKLELEFKELKSFFNETKRTFFPNNDYFGTLSMGMSSDFQQAIACGSTMVRIGSTIFGRRN
ncbi:YggS family pyridoxal phosphate-dependent enzyme [Halosquirtibacter laminarini]|uniref:YggS family pyridoxal phosphate-dependent enzyme n=1 Tax=Halosquirtibacter laminarini TaxID=3374600 RepID=A0AC61NLS5_9BACT|nr:YggS family pyridoxal phosphate-dependent enzyme [Prolixibacteraceae bacterium]